MINATMKNYDFFTFGEVDSYGQQQLSEDVKGSVKMSINLTSQSTQDNINYQDANYIGLTFSTGINDSYVIKYGEEKLKVLYVNPNGRYTQVYLKRI